MNEHTKEHLDSLRVQFWAPWSSTLWLVKAAAPWDKKICRKRGYHEFEDVSNAVGRYSGMEWEILFCEGCQGYFDEAFKKTSGEPDDPLLGKCLDGLGFRRKLG
jgi:hypothetical protein